MHPKKRKSISKYLSLLLRHKPHIIGLHLDPEGWADIEELIDKSRQKGRKLTLKQVKEIIRQSDKDRFTLNRDQTKIRANYGHSIDIYPDYHPQKPPEHLYHGTARHNLSSIREHGLQPQNRKFVHLSPDYPTAVSVGKRYGKPIVLIVRTLELYQDGQQFYQAGADVWLTSTVPPTALQFPE